MYRALSVVSLLLFLGGFIASIQAEPIKRENPEEFYYQADWKDLTSEERKAWGVLGWSQALWDADSIDIPKTEFSLWVELTPDQHKALSSLGYSSTYWDSTRPRSPSSEPEAFWNAMKWTELRPSEQHLWKQLGWTSQSWSEDAPVPASETKVWAELTEGQRFVAGKLGYNQTLWDKAE